MKLKITTLVLPVFLLFFSNFSVFESKKLTENENRERAKNCGKLRLPDRFDNGSINVAKDAWIVRVHNKNGSSGSDSDSLASFISPRHVITSAQPIMKNGKRWTMDDVPWDRKLMDNTNNSIVPQKYLQNLEITSEHCAGIRISGCQKTVFQPKKAWILDLHHYDTEYDQLAAIMLVEVLPTDVQYACLNIDEEVVINETDRVYAYGLENSNNNQSQLKFRNETITETSERFVFVKKYFQSGDRGGPLIKIINNVSTIIGIGASPGYNDASYNTYFFNTLNYRNSLCRHCGICYINPVDLVDTTTEIPTTTSSESTSTTDSSTTSESLEEVTDRIEEYETEEDRKNEEKEEKEEEDMEKHRYDYDDRIGGNHSEDQFGWKLTLILLIFMVFGGGF